MQLRRRFWPEVVLATLSGFLAILTIAWRDWLEVATGLNPDQHSGTVEVGIILTLAVGSVAMAWCARAEWLRARVTAPQAPVRV